MIGAVDTSDWIIPVVSTLLGGGLIGGYVSLRKLKPEGDQIIVSAAKDVVVVQKGLLDDMRNEIDEMRRRFTQRERIQDAALTACEEREKEMRLRIVALEKANEDR